jgi:hypothetical protein
MCGVICPNSNDRLGLGCALRRMRCPIRSLSSSTGCDRIARQMTLMELLGMERQQLQTRRELENLRLEARAAQVRRQSSDLSDESHMHASFGATAVSESTSGERTTVHLTSHTLPVVKHILRIAPADFAHPTQDAAAAALVEVLRRLPPQGRRKAAPAAATPAAPAGRKAPPPLPDVPPPTQGHLAADARGPAAVDAGAEWDLALARGPRTAEVPSFPPSSFCPATMPAERK